MKQLNKAAILVGPPQYGKTTLAKQLALAHLDEGGWLLAHDPNAQFDFATHYECAADWLAALARGEPMSRAASIGGKAEDVTRAAVALGRKHNKAKDVRLPMMIVYDESSLLGTSGGSYLGELDSALLSNRRHWGIATVYNVQRPTALTEGFYSLATDVFIFGLPSERRTDKLEEYLGLRDGQLAPLVGLGPYRFAHWQSGNGLV